MSSVAAIVQARMGSGRLPGKSLLKVYKELSLLEMVLLRTLKAGNVDLVILATSEMPDCDPLETLARDMGTAVVRGSEDDVLSRFIKVIETYSPDSVVRICADNPLIDPREIDKLVSFFGSGDYEYAANNTPECGLPDGLGCEMVRAATLIEIAGTAREQRYREHVTEYITSHPDKFSTGWLQADTELRRPELKLDIDTMEDLGKMRKFCSTLPANNAPYWSAEEIILNTGMGYQA